jgi:hypothetical protein
MMMTPMLLLALLAVLLAVLVWQITSLRRWRSGRRSGSQQSRPRPVQKVDQNAQVARLADPSPLVLKRERKRDLSAINAKLEGFGPADDSVKLSLYNEVEEKLAQAFELYEAGAISIDGYEAIVRIEGKVVHRKRSELKALEMADTISAAGLDEFRQDAEAAEIAIQWCLDWAAGRRESVPNAQFGPNQS